MASKSLHTNCLGFSKTSFPWFSRLPHEGVLFDTAYQTQLNKLNKSNKSNN